MSNQHNGMYLVAQLGALLAGIEEKKSRLEILTAQLQHDQSKFDQIALILAPPRNARKGELIISADLGSSAVSPLFEDACGCNEAETIEVNESQTPSKGIGFLESSLPNPGTQGRAILDCVARHRRVALAWSEHQKQPDVLLGDKS